MENVATGGQGPGTCARVQKGSNQINTSGINLLGIFPPNVIIGSKKYCHSAKSMSPTILIVDDEPTIRAFVSNILKIEGYQVIEAADGLDALEQVQRRGTPVDLVLTDIRMPRLDGVALARSLHNLYPRLPVLYISGYPFDVESEQSKYAGRPCGFVPKPFTRKSLLEAVQKCLSAPEPTIGIAI